MSLFSAFYFLILHSIESILIQQSTEIVDDFKTHFTNSHATFVRQTKLLRLSRGVKKEFLRDINEGTGMSSEWFRKFSLNWYKKIDDDRYRSVAFLNRNRVPVAVTDFANSERIVTMVLGPESSTKKTETKNKENLPLPVGTSTLSLSWSDNTTITGAYTIILPDSTSLLRAVYEILSRKGGEPVGYVGIDRKLELVIEKDKSRNRGLLIYDWDSEHIVYDSVNLIPAAEVMENIHPHLYNQTVNVGIEQITELDRYQLDGKSYIASAMKFKEPTWTVISTVWLDPYVAVSESRGQILIVGSVFFVLIAGTSIYVLTLRVRRRTEELVRANDVVSVHNKMLEDELQTAHDMQMRLMPQENPSITGFDIVGFCKPATEVGGDFYQYYPLPDERLAITLADVTGHGMQAAIPTMVFSGLLDNQIQYTPAPNELMGRLNASLYRVLERRTFVCFSMIELYPQERRLRLANGGCPYPYLFRAKENTIEEVSLGALPLGLRSDSSYSVVEVDLENHDFIVLCSDGLIEAANETGELFGFERTAETIRQAGISGFSAAELVQRLFDEIGDFVGEELQEDDQTMVVIRVVGDEEINKKNCGDSSDFPHLD